MHPLALLLLAAVTVRQDTALRTGCEASDTEVAQVKAGDEVRIRFSLAGSATPCYKVSAGGATGYVSGSLLDGLERFESERNLASSETGSIKITRAEGERIQQKAMAAVGAAGPAAEAVRLINAGQPKAALAKLEILMGAGLRSPDVLAVAGVAAWKGDDPKQALIYWKQALEIKEDPQLRRLCAMAEREAAGDRSRNKTVGLRVDLRYEGESVTPGLAAEMVEALDSEYGRISGQLGCRAEERITAIVQSRDAYLKTTGAAVWSGGSFDGRIRIALLDQERGVGPLTRRVFAHELVHACLASLGNWPTWFHEGLAQRFSGEQLTAEQTRQIEGLIRARALPRLNDLGRDWSGMTGDRAYAAYRLSLRAADLMLEDYGAYGIRNILASPRKVAEITDALDRKLGLPERR